MHTCSTACVRPPRPDNALTSPRLLSAGGFRTRAVPRPPAALHLWHAGGLHRCGTVLLLPLPFARARQVSHPRVSTPLAAAGALPALSPPQLLKLRQLTVASLAADAQARVPPLSVSPLVPAVNTPCPAFLVQSIPYAQLVAALDMPLPPGGSVRALEDFLINECLTQVRLPAQPNAGVHMSHPPSTLTHILLYPQPPGRGPWQAGPGEAGAACHLVPGS